jgi:hypothetical protein
MACWPLTLQAPTNGKDSEVRTAEGPIGPLQPRNDKAIRSSECAAAGRARFRALFGEDVADYHSPFFGVYWPFDKNRLSRLRRETTLILGNTRVTIAVPYCDILYHKECRASFLRTDPAPP